MIKYNTNYSKITKRDLNAHELDELREFADEINGHNIGKSKSKNNGFLHKSVAPKFDRETPIVAGDKRPIWETQTKTGFGLSNDDTIDTYTTNYVPCAKPGRIDPTIKPINTCITILFKRFKLAMARKTFDHNYMVGCGVKKFDLLNRNLSPFTDVKHDGGAIGNGLIHNAIIKYRKPTNKPTMFKPTDAYIHDGMKIPNMHRGGKRVELPSDYVPGIDGFYKPLFAYPQNQHINFNMD